MKNNLIQLFSALLFLVFLSSCSDDPIPLRDPDVTSVERTYTWAATADSMQQATYNIYLGPNGTFVADNGGDATINYWPNAHVLHTLVDAYERTEDETYLPRMKALLEGIETENGGTYSNVFNDDMLWLGNSSVRAYEATNDQQYLDVALFLWEDILESYSDVLGGGITWKKNTPNQKNAVSNGPAVVLAMRLYEITEEATYLDWAKRLYDWEKSNLVDPATGLVWDNISIENGNVTVQKDWIFTYNMGTWIGAGTRLYQATGDQVYLDDALRSARVLMTSPELTSQGILNDEGQGDGGLFKGILVRYFTDLIFLEDVPEEDRQEFIDFMRFNATTLYDNGLKRYEMLAGPNWSEVPEGTVDLTTQLSGLMLMEAAARLNEGSIFEN